MCDLFPAKRQGPEGAASFEGVRLLIVVVPMHLEEVGPVEGTWSKIAECALTPIDTSEQWRRAMRFSGLEYVDMWPAFISELKSPGYRALFNPADNHLHPARPRTGGGCGGAAFVKTTLIRGVE